MAQIPSTIFVQAPNTMIPLIVKTVGHNLSLSTFDFPCKCVLLNHFILLVLHPVIHVKRVPCNHKVCASTTFLRIKNDRIVNIDASEKTNEKLQARVYCTVH